MTSTAIQGFSKRAHTDEVVHSLLLEHQADGMLPTNGRFVFYELEQRGDATKPSPDDGRKNKRRSKGWPPGSQDITDSLKRLRDEGTIPWEWIVDETRQLDVWLHAGSVLDYMYDRLPEATINPWGEHDPPLILCETRATAGVLRSVAAGYVCPIVGTAGQVGGFLHTVIAPMLQRASRTSIFYIGDLDKAGADIEKNTRRVLERTLNRALPWRRIAITEEQVETLDLEPIWKVDGRDRLEREAFEAEALGQAGLVELVQETLDELLPGAARGCSGTRRSRARTAESTSLGLARESMSRPPRIPGTPARRRALYILPGIDDDLTPAEKNALAIRNACSVEGICPVCGTVGVVHEDDDAKGVFHITFRHEDWCPVYRDAA